MDFYNNQENDKIKFKLNAEGIDVSGIESRLVFIGENKSNCIIFGEVNENVCTFSVPELAMYKKDNSGKVRFELIAEGNYYNVWEDKFKVKTKATVKLDEMVTESFKKVIPKIVSSEPILEKRKQSTQPKPIIKEKEVINENVTEKPKDESFVTFLDYLNNPDD